jgi:hypothetical protein
MIKPENVPFYLLKPFELLKNFNGIKKSLHSGISSLPVT